MGKIGINDFQIFCKEYNIPFVGVDTDKYIKEFKKRTGEELTVGELKYIVVPE